MNKLDDANLLLKAFTPEQQEVVANLIFDLAEQVTSDLTLTDEQVAEMERRANDPLTEYMSLEEFCERVEKLRR
jgi:hypothetical protein